MAAVTDNSDFGAPENKTVTASTFFFFTFSPICHEVMIGARYHDLNSFAYQVFFFLILFYF